MVTLFIVIGFTMIKCVGGDCAITTTKELADLVATGSLEILLEGFGFIIMKLKQK